MRVLKWKCVPKINNLILSWDQVALCSSISVAFRVGISVNLCFIVVGYSKSRDVIADLTGCHGTAYGGRRMLPC